MNILAELPTVANWPEAFTYAVFAICAAACVVAFIFRS
jgi:hypothetical protein